MTKQIPVENKLHLQTPEFVKKEPQVSEECHGAKRWFSPAIILIFANSLIFLSMLASMISIRGADNTPLFGTFGTDFVVEWGSNYGPYTIGGQYWRPVSSLFVHRDILHLVGNLILLAMLAAPVQLLVGRLNTLFAYVFLGASASLVSTAAHPTLNSFGSSGALVGFAGIVLGYFALVRQFPAGVRTRFTIVVAGLAVLVALASGLKAGVDNVAHVAGLALGLILGGILGIGARSHNEGSRFRVSGIFVIGFTALLLLLIVVVNVHSAVAEFYRGEIAIKHHDPASAVDHISNFVAVYPNDVVGHGELGQAYSELGKNEEAAREYRRWLEIEPWNRVARYNLGRIDIATGRFAEAVPLLMTSVPNLAPDDEKYYNLALALMRTGELQSAEEFAGLSISLNPGSSRNHDLLSAILLAEGKTQQSEKEHGVAEQLRSHK